MELLDGVFSGAFGEAVGEGFKRAELVSVYARSVERERIREGLAAVGAGVFYAQQTNIGVAGYPEPAGYLVHGSADAPCSCSDGQHEKSYSADERSFFAERSLCGRSGVVSGYHVLPADGHVLFSEFAHMVLLVFLSRVCEMQYIKVQIVS